MGYELTEVSVSVDDGDTVVGGEDFIDYRIAGVATERWSAITALEIAVPYSEPHRLSPNEGEDWEVSGTIDIRDSPNWPNVGGTRLRFRVGGDIVADPFIDIEQSDRSEIRRPVDLDLSSPAAEEIEAVVTAENIIQRGDGESLSARVFLTVDGDLVETLNIPTDPGGTGTATVLIDGVVGETEVCAELD